jgi:hypothetical protein
MANEGLQRYVVNDKSPIVYHSIRELGVIDGKPPDFGEKLDFKERNRRDTPGSISIQPGKFSQPF